MLRICCECGVDAETLYRAEDSRGDPLLVCWYCYSGQEREE